MSPTNMIPRCHFFRSTPSGDFGRWWPIVPGELHRRPVAAGRMLPADDQPIGVRFAAHRQRAPRPRPSSGYCNCKAQNGQVDRVAPHVAQRPVAEIPPVLPGHGAVLEVARMIGPPRAPVPATGPSAGSWGPAAFPAVGCEGLRCPGPPRRAPREPARSRRIESARPRGGSCRWRGSACPSGSPRCICSEVSRITRAS